MSKECRGAAVCVRDSQNGFGDGGERKDKLGIIFIYINI